MKLHLKSHVGRSVKSEIQLPFFLMRWLPFELSEEWLEMFLVFWWQITICCTIGDEVNICAECSRERERGVSLYRKLLQQTRPERLLFTGQLGVEAGESNAEGLDCAHWVPANIIQFQWWRENLTSCLVLLVIHGEDVLGYPSELHNDVLIVWIMNYLEILNRGLQIMTINHIQIRPSPTWVTLPWKFKT